MLDPSRRSRPSKMLANAVASGRVLERWSRGRLLGAVGHSRARRAWRGRDVARREQGGYPSLMSDPFLVPPGPLVDAAWLAAHAGDPRVRVVDCRWYLGGRRGADEYARGHIPGAVHLDVDADLSSPAHGGPGRHPLPDAAAFARVLGRIG